MAASSAFPSKDISSPPDDPLAKQESFSVLEVLELFKNSKPFPVSYQKGWKMHSFVHGHRVWFHFLTFTRAQSPVVTSATTHNASSGAPCIKVFATFDRVRASSQSLLQLVKDASLSCEWRPGVIAARSVHEVPASEVNPRGRGSASPPVLNDFVRVERVQPARYRWPWRRRSRDNIVTPTVIEDFKRYWYREENGCSWLLQMNEEAQSLVFFLIQPVEDADHSLLTVVTWSANHADPVIPVDEAPSVLLSSLSDYIQLRRVHMTPLLHISLPHNLLAAQQQDGHNNPHHTVHPNLNSSKEKYPQNPPNNSGGGAASPADSLISRFKQFVQKSTTATTTTTTTTGNNNNNVGLNSKPTASSSTTSSSVASSDTIRRSAMILHHRTQSTGSLLSKSGLNADQSQVIQEEENESEDADSGDLEKAADGSAASGGLDRKAVAGGGGDRGEEGEGDGERKRAALRRSVSEMSPRPASAGPNNVAVPESEAAVKAIARYKTMLNKAAADIMAEALRASNIDLESAPSTQAEVSAGWTYVGFENNIVTLKKIPQNGSTVQSYIGKGFILAPPKIVWDAIRNPRTRFTYDETLKKVDVVDQVAQGIKIVYLYQEVQQLIRKECCDVCCLQGERVEGSKYILAYTSLHHPKFPSVDNVLRGKMCSSGWIIEPVRKEKRLYSLVTYIMQMDYGASRSGGPPPLEDMMSRHPSSLFFLQQYLKPAVQLARRKSAPVLQL